MTDLNPTHPRGYAVNITDAIDIMESISGVTDESTPVGEAWNVILRGIHNPRWIEESDAFAIVQMRLDDLAGDQELMIYRWPKAGDWHIEHTNPFRRFSWEKSTANTVALAPPLKKQSASSPTPYPPPEIANDGATDEELREMWFGSEWFNEGATLREFISIARAVLARWGAPAAVPVPASERLPGAEDCDEQPVEPTDDSDLLQFLLDNFRSRSLHMDGTAYYVLDTGWPFNHRSSNSRAFVEQAYHKSCEHFRKQS